MNQLRIFWSWQADLPSSVNRTFVREALEEAAKAVAEELGLTDAERPEIDHDTKDIPGWAKITDTILEKIDGCAIFVADVTPVAVSGTKKVPNPNVVLELGYALKSIGFQKLILVCNAAFGGDKPEELPFDMRDRRAPIFYDLAPSSDGKRRDAQRGKLVGALIDALTLNLGEAVAKKDAAVEFRRQPSREGDPSTWLPLGGAITHRQFHDDPREESWTVVEAPRAYMRVIPAAWPAGKKPSRRQIHDANEDYTLWPLGRWTNGDGGLNTLGVVKVGLSGHGAPVVYSATQWFDAT